MGLSHAELRRWYHGYNRAYFFGRLPREMAVYYAPHDEAHGEAVRGETGACSIQIDTTLAGTRYARMTLLHEMVHHYTGDWGHGRRFQAGMLRLAVAGAFRKVW